VRSTAVPVVPRGPGRGRNAHSGRWRAGGRWELRWKASWRPRGWPLESTHSAGCTSSSILCGMDEYVRNQQGPRRALVFGGSGQIGERLLANLHDAGWQVTAVSRQVQPSRPGLEWISGDLSATWQGAADFDAIFSCGPLDHFARWFATNVIKAPRVVAFGSTSVDVKQDSIEPAERDVARRLREAEARLFATSRERGVAATVLRPTLV